MYTSGDYVGSLNACNSSMSQFEKSSLLHRFGLLKALCIDKISGRDAFKIELQKVIEVYKGTESALTAQRLLDAINGKGDNPTNPEIVIKPEFVFDANAEHFVILYIPDATKKVDGAVGKIVEFNDMEFEGREYTVTNSILPQSGQVILIRKFSSSLEALVYVKKYDEKGIVLKLNLNAPSKIMAISKVNYATLVKTPSMAEYQNFYSDNYK
jgi:hypothetical protein